MRALAIAGLNRVYHRELLPLPQGGDAGELGMQGEEAVQRQVVPAVVVVDLAAGGEQLGIARCRHQGQAVGAAAQD